MGRYNVDSDEVCNTISSILRCDAVSLGKYFPTFRMTRGFIIMVSQSKKMCVFSKTAVRAWNIEVCEIWGSGSGEYEVSDHRLEYDAVYEFTLQMEVTFSPKQK